MMLLVNQSQITTLPTVSQEELLQLSIRYRGWLINTKVLNGQLWLRWQHPLDDCSRYGCSVSEAGIDATISHAKSLIDLTMELESEVQPTRVVRSMAMTSDSSAFLWN